MTEHAALRWGVVVAFLIAAGIVVVRHVRVPVASGATGADGPGVWSAGEADHEGDAAHLVMCLVMLAMLLFPATAAPDAIRGVLTAMIVVYAILLVLRTSPWRTGQWHKRFAAADLRTPAVAYHLVAALSMLWVISGHRHGGGEMPAVPVAPVLIAAALFAVDAVLLIVPRTRHLLRHNVSHRAGVPGALGTVPHVVMDLGTAYMLVAAVAG